MIPLPIARNRDRFETDVVRQLQRFVNRTAGSRKSLVIITADRCHMQQILAVSAAGSCHKRFAESQRTFLSMGIILVQTASCAGTGHCTADTAIRGNNCQTEEQ